MYAFVSLDPADDTEGICAFFSPLFKTAMPMVGADMRRVEDLRPIAQKLASETGIEIKLLRFEVRTELDVIEP